MAIVTYQFVDFTTSSGVVAPEALQQEIIDDPAIPVQVLGVTVSTDVQIEFQVALDGPQTTALDAVVAAHTGEALPDEGQVTQINIDESSDKTLTGLQDWDRDQGGILKIPRGTSFPVSPSLNELFLRTDTDSLHRWDGSAWQNLSTGGGGGTDELVKISANDTTAGYLFAKLVAGAGITLTEQNDGGNETLEIASGGGGGGDVTGPAGATNNAVARYDGATGKLLKDSAVTISDPGSISVPAGQTVGGRNLTTDGTKLDGIEPGATADQVITAGAGLTGGGSGDVTLNIVAGDGSIEVMADSIEVGEVSDTQHGNRGGGGLHPAATGSVAGFMSSVDKNKLDGIEAGAKDDQAITAGAGLTGGGTGDVTLDVVAADGSIVVNADSIAVGEISDAQHGNRGGGLLHAAATTSVAGFMSAADKTKLDGIEDDADVDAKDVQVSANDATSGFLIQKIVPGTGITITELNDGAAETLQISAGGGGGGALDAFSAYDSLGTQSFTGTVTVNIDQEQFASSATYSLVNDEVTITVSGRFLIAYECTLESTGNNRTQADTWLERNGGQLVGTFATAYVRQTNYGATTACTVIVDVTANDVIRLRAQRVAGNNSVITIDEGSRITIARID